MFACENTAINLIDNMDIDNAQNIHSGELICLFIKEVLHNLLLSTRKN